MLGLAAIVVLEPCSGLICSAMPRTSTSSNAGRSDMEPVSTRFHSSWPCAVSNIFADSVMPCWAPSMRPYMMCGTRLALPSAMMSSVPGGLRSGLAGQNITGCRSATRSTMCCVNAIAIPVFALSSSLRLLRNGTIATRAACEAIGSSADASHSAPRSWQGSGGGTLGYCAESGLLERASASSAATGSDANREADGRRIRWVNGRGRREREYWPCQRSPPHLLRGSGTPETPDGRCRPRRAP